MRQATEEQLLSKPKFETREEWLVAAKDELTPIFRKAGYKIPRKVRVGCGYPATGGTRRSKSGSMTIGQCLMNCSADDHHEIFIHPIQDTPIFENGSGVLETLTHELLHACLPPQTGHKKLFSQGCKALGLEGKPTSTHAGDKLRAQLQEIAERLGKYPHGALNFSGKKAKTKMLAVRCTQCECVVRMTQKWLDEVGPPECGCGAPMVEQDKPDPNAIKLRHTESITVYSSPDDRFAIKVLKNQRDGTRWLLVDYEWGGKLIACESKQDCLDTIDAIREGVYLPDEDEDVDLDAEWEVDEFELNHSPFFEMLDLPHHLNDWEVEEHDVPEDNDPADPFEFERAKGIEHGAWATGRDPYVEDEPASILPASYPEPRPETVAIFGRENLRS